jgi:hypothetical protein
VAFVHVPGPPGARIKYIIFIFVRHVQRFGHPHLYTARSSKEWSESNGRSAGILTALYLGVRVFIRNRPRLLRYEATPLPHVALVAV